MVGLTAFEPLGRSRTSPVWPSASCVVTILAPPLSVHPPASKLSTVCPGVSMYQLASPADRTAGIGPAASTAPGPSGWCPLARDWPRDRQTWPLDRQTWLRERCTHGLSVSDG